MNNRAKEFADKVLGERPEPCYKDITISRYRLEAMLCDFAIQEIKGRKVSLNGKELLSILQVSNRVCVCKENTGVFYLEGIPHCLYCKKARVQEA